MVSDRTTHRRFKRQTAWIFILLIAIGIGFRFGNLNQVYWHDETFTALRMSGHRALEARDAVFDEVIRTAEDFERYQWPNADKNIIDTVTSLALDDPQHPPVYYVLVRQWVAAFGRSIWITRSFSALLSLLALPAMYWLIQELFAFADVQQVYTSSQRQLAGLIATTLVALSPFHILYAQEAREYALWTVLILTVNAVFLKALRQPNNLYWVAYTLLLVLSLYTHPFTGFFALGHLAYIVLIEKFRPTRRAIACLLGVAIGLASFTPWAWILLNNDFNLIGLSWISQPIPFDALLKAWGLHFVRGFLLTRGDYGFDTWQVYTGLPLAMLLIGYALYFVARRTPVRFWLFVWALVISSCLPLIIPDLLMGGQRSTSARYLVPTLLGVQIAIALLLAVQIHHPQMLWRRFWRGVAIVLTMVALTSGISILQAEATWPKFLSYNLPTIVRTVEQSPQPLVISSMDGINYGTVFALTHRITPKVRLILFDYGQVLTNPTTPKLNETFTNVFLLNPSDELRASVEQHENAAAELIFNDSYLYLWKLMG